MVMYEINLNSGDEIEIEIITDKATFQDREKWKVKQIYKNYVLCEKKVKLGMIRRCVCMGDLVRYGYATEKRDF